MRTKPIITGAVVIAFFVLILILFTFLRPPTPAFVIRHFKRNVSPVYGITQTFGVTNNRMSMCYFYPTEIEVLEGTNWKTCSRISFKVSGGSMLDPHKGKFFTAENVELPLGRPLRLKMAVGWELKGLSGAVRRFELRFRHGKTSVSLNPFTKTSKVFCNSIEISSDEFIEPVPATNR